MNSEDILPGNRGGNRGRNMDNVENVDRTNNAQYSYRVRNPQIRFGKAYTLYITLKKNYGRGEDMWYMRWSVRIESWCSF